MQRSGGLRRVIVGFMALVGLMLLVDVISAPPIEPSAAHSSDVLGQVEVRERQKTLSDGRTTSESEAASGLSTRYQRHGRGSGVLVAPAQQGLRTRPVSEVFVLPSIPAARAEEEAVFSSSTNGSAVTAAAATSDAERVGGQEDLLDDQRARRGAEALELIEFPWQEQLPGWTVDFLSANSGLRGLTFTEEGRIEVYLRDGETAAAAARVIAHELGHAVDLSLLQEEDREFWHVQRGIGDAVPWWPGDGLADFATGAGDFAECFATWQVGSATLSRVAGACSAADVDLLVEMVGARGPGREVSEATG